MHNIPHTKEAKEKIKRNHWSKLKNREEIIKKVSKTWIKKKQHLSPKTEFKKGQTAPNKGKHFIHSGSFKKGHKVPQEWRDSIRSKNKGHTLKRWSNPEYKERVIKKWMKSCHKKPNKKEQLLNYILQDNFPNEWKYVGNGEFILGGKCPDFLNINGEKKIIELFGNYWHRNDNPQNRIDYFKQFGFETLIIWESELESSHIIKRIRNFCSGGCFG